MKPNKPDKKQKPISASRKRTKPQSKTPSTPPVKEAKAEALTKKSRVKIPAILLEGDVPPIPQATGSGKRYSLGGAAAEGVPRSSMARELPDSYGTKRLWLTARDPHWLYACWDISREQLTHYNRLSTDRHLVLRVHENTLSGQPQSEIHLHPESRYWFVHVEGGGRKYVADLGYYEANRRWTTVAISHATLTPPETVSSETLVQFATIPETVSLERLVAVVKEAVGESIPVMEAVQQLHAMGYSNIPKILPTKADDWTPAQEKALAKAITMDETRRVWIGSLEITELVRRNLVEEISSQAVTQFGQPEAWSGVMSEAVFSPLGGDQRSKGFWFSVNAELIIYGATEPDAAVTISGRRVRLRSDGTFSYRFALPDGRYDLEAVATSAVGDDARVAALTFSRGTKYRGKVERHPQDPELKPPYPAHIS